jgi:hypothetical protein
MEAWVGVDGSLEKPCIVHESVLQAAWDMK